MSKETQIEEMARDLENHTCMSQFQAEIASKILYAKGYRKQAWISVSERLPEASGKYIVCTKRGNVYQTKFYSYPENKGGHWGQKDKGRSITHWMPLPEAPRKEDEGK